MSHYLTHPKTSGANKMATTPMPTPVRLPPELKEWVKAYAKENRRSVSAEIVNMVARAKEQIERQAAMT